MAFPASQQVLADALVAAQRTVLRHKAFMAQVSSVMATNTVSANQVIQVMQLTKDALAVVDNSAAVSGMAQYAKDQLDNQAIDIIAEFQVMRAALVDVRDWVITNFPKSAGGFIEKDTLEADGAITVRQFTSPQTSGLRTVLDAAIATIG